MKKINLLIIILGTFILSGCTVFKSDVMEDIDVYTTTYPTSYLIKYLYNNHATVHSIYPTGINFKEYDLSDKIRHSGIIQWNSSVRWDLDSLGSHL